MFSDEIRETIFIGVSLFLAAAVLGMVSIVISLRGDFATVRNDEIATTRQIKAYREYNSYNDTVVTSEEVIALITKYYDKDVDIYYNDNGVQRRYNKDTLRADPTLVEIDRLMSDIGTGGQHWVGLLYDFQDVTTVTGPSSISGSIHSDVTGIVILDSSAQNN